MKIFLDANIIVAACGNPEGGSGYLFKIAEHDERFQLLTSFYALAEARLNVRKKLAERYKAFVQIATSPFVTVVHPPPREIVTLAERIVPAKDAPIVAAAISCHADALCTLDQKDFHTAAVKRWTRGFNLKIVTPKDVLIEWRTQATKRP